MVAFALAAGAWMGTAKAAPIVLTFEGLQNQEQVLNFYNGGTGSLGSTGTNYGISFGGDALGIIDADAGGTGNFGGEPSPSTGVFFLNGSAAIMNVAAGFDTGFSFFYSAINSPGSVTVYDGLNGTGNVLTTLNLPLTPNTGAPDPTGNFSPLLPFGVTFAGTAHSASFAGTANQIVFDDITLGSATPGDQGPVVPLPAAVWGGMALLSGLGVSKRLRRRNETELNLA
jgi:hypothetical protein